MKICLHRPLQFYRQPCGRGQVLYFLKEISIFQSQLQGSTGDKIANSCLKILLILSQPGFKLPRPSQLNALYTYIRSWLKTSNAYNINMIILTFGQ